MTEYAPSLTREGQFSPLVLGKLGETFVPRTEWATPADPTVLPPHAGTRTKTYRAPNYNAESPALVNARELITQALAGQRATEILFIGDSKTEGAGLAGAQVGKTGEWSYPAQIRRQLAAREGLIVANVAGGDARWSVSGMTRSGSDRNALAPFTPGSGLSKWAQIVTGPNTGGTMWVQATAGATINLTVDGATSSAVLPAQAGWQAVPTATLADGTHTVRVESTADFDVLGITPTHPTPGLRITRAGRSSSSAVQWLSSGATDGHWKSVVESPATTPDIIVCGLGTNSPADTASLTSLFASLAALAVPVLIVSPGGLGQLSPIATYDAARDALYDAADARDFPLIDFEAVIGQYAKANGNGLMGDTVHENGRGYALEAEAVARLVNLS